MKIYLLKNSELKPIKKRGKVLDYLSVNIIENIIN